MKNWIKTGSVLMTVVIFLIACTKEETPLKADESFTVREADSLIYEANFMSSGKSTSGTVEVYENDGEHTLAFSDFKTGNGPDIRVYLSVNQKGDEFINLGDLRAVEGSFTYEIPANVDLEKYDHVLIWCDDFSLLFGYADIVQ